MYHSQISGVGAYLPEKIITNAEMSKIVDTSDEWIVKRTGIKQRHIVADGELCSDLATKAALNAMKNANISVSDIDGVIVATASSDNAFPATAAVVAKNIGVKKGFAYDVGAACAGFIFALNCADNAIRLNQAKNILVIGAEVFSRFMDWEDRNTCVLFGDGAGAVVLSSTDSENHILSTHIHSDGSYASDLITAASNNNPELSKRGIHMDGKAVFKFAVRAMGDSVKEAITANDLDLSQLNYVVPHQANIRIIESVADYLGLNIENVVISLEKHANISAATVPVALNKAVQENTFKSGDLVALTGMGAGFSWGSALLRWK